MKLHFSLLTITVYAAHFQNQGINCLWASLIPLTRMCWCSLKPKRKRQRGIWVSILTKIEFIYICTPMWIKQQVISASVLSTVCIIIYQQLPCSCNPQSSKFMLYLFRRTTECMLKGWGFKYSSPHTSQLSVAVGLPVYIRLPIPRLRSQLLNTGSPSAFPLGY